MVLSSQRSGAILDAIRVRIQNIGRMISINLLFSRRSVHPSQYHHMITAGMIKKDRTAVVRFTFPPILSLLLFTLALITTNQVHAQPGEPVSGEGPRWFGTTGKATPYDTASRKQLSSLALESAGLLEGAIEPDEYYVGPNDALSITIWTANTKVQDVLVTPDGKALIQSVGEVNLRGKTLAEAEEAIKKAVARVYNVNASVSLRKMREFKVSIIGAVKTPTSVSATPTTRVSEVIDLAGGARPSDANKRDITIYRKVDSKNRVEIPVDLLPYYAFADYDSNPFVADGDVIKIGIVDPKKVVQIIGAVAQQGEYPWRANDSISTIINASFGLTADAKRDSIAVITKNEAGEIIRQTWHSMLPDGSITDDRPLMNGDEIYIYQKPKFLERNQVVVRGEVSQPGVYPVIPGTTKLREILAVAGGFTEKASLLDAVLIRRNAIGKPDEYLAYILAIEPENRTPAEAEYLRTKLLEGQKQGLMIVDFNALMQGDETQNLTLIDNDSLYVPKEVDYIGISGKVKNAGNFLYRPGFGYEDYIAMAGGYGWKAEKGETQIIKGRSGDRLPAEDRENYTIEPGDAIFVPEEKPGNFWEGFATALTIVTQTAAIVALVLSLTNKQP